MSFWYILSILHFYTGLTLTLTITLIQIEAAFFHTLKTVWLATFLGVLVFDVDIGLYIGLAFNVLLMVLKTQRPKITALGNIDRTELYEELKACENVR